MKKGVKRGIIAAVAAAAALLAAYNTAAAVSLSDEYDGDGGFFPRASYSLSHLFTDPVADTFKKTVYHVFGAVAEPGVDAGYDGCLFPSKTEDFDYKADIKGGYRYDKAAFLSALEARRDALALDGCGFYVYVIPNSQTVLRDKVKGADKTAVTAAKDLEKYLNGNGFDNFRLLDKELTSPEVPAYHNTENAVNEYGAYLIYKAVAAGMPEAVTRRFEEITIEKSDITSYYTDGRELAVRAGIEKAAKNLTVVYPTVPYTSRYTSEYKNGCTVCRLREEYNDFIGSSEILFQIPDPGARESLKPLFSASYTDTVYKNTLSYSEKTMELGRFSVCVYIIREDELSALLDNADTATYRARTDEYERGGVSAAPQVVCASCKSSGTVIVAGDSEENGTVTVSSSSDSVSVPCLDGRFIAELKAKPNEKLTLTATGEGKETSERVYYNAPAATSCEETVFAGGGSMLYYGWTVDDYTGANLAHPATEQHTGDRFEKTFDKILKKVREASGKDTKILFLAAPNPLTVYPGAASKELIQKRAERTMYDVFAESVGKIDGVEVLDIREVMRQNTDVGKLYYQTDTHWTELGAYFGYRAVVEAVAADFPAVSPYSLSMFGFEEKEVSAGDLSGFAKLSGFTENVTFLKPNFRLRAVGTPEKPDTVDRSVYGGELRSAVDNAEYPVAVMVRDSYSANLFPWISEHFSYLYCRSMWSYTPDYEEIAVLKPDYVIYVVCERNLRSLI